MSVQRIPSGDAGVDRALGPVVSAIEELQRAQEVLFEGVHLVNAIPYRLVHGLGRRFRGWYVVDTIGATAAGQIRRTITGDPTTEIWLVALGHGATITVSVRVF